MTNNKLKGIIDHLWHFREYLFYVPQFDFPFYGGIRKTYKLSPEAVDAMQNIWDSFRSGEYKSKKSFLTAYKKELSRLGEDIK